MGHWVSIGMNLQSELFRIGSIWWQFSSILLTSHRIANCVFTLPAFWYIDKLGRRSLLMATQPVMTIAMFGACLSFLAADPHLRLVFVSVFLFLFIAAYSVGQGPGKWYSLMLKAWGWHLSSELTRAVAFAYASESFPLIYREVRPFRC